MAKKFQKFIDPKQVQKENRKLRKSLTELTEGVVLFLTLIDDEMRKHCTGPEHNEFGKKIATLMNAMEFLNDQQRFFALGIDFRNDEKAKAKIIKRLKGEKS